MGKRSQRSKRRKRNRHNFGDLPMNPAPTILQNSPAAINRGASQRPACHTGPVKVFSIGKATIWAGSRTEIILAHKPWTLLLCCAGHDMAPAAPVLSSTGVPEGILSETEYPWISLDWSDGDIPSRIPYLFWDRLADALANGQIEGDVGVYCLGGHGRTGTALSILASFCGAVPTGHDPVAWLRKRYCNEVVETDEQCQYVERITGRAVNAKGSIMAAWHDFFAKEDQCKTPEQERAEALARIAKVWEEIEAEEAAKRIPIINSAGDVIGYEEEGDLYDDEDEKHRY